MSLRFILVFIVLWFRRTEAGQCSALTGENVPCVNHVLIAIDASNYIIDQNLALKTIDFVSATLMPKWSASKKTLFSFSLYGLADRSNLICFGYVTYGQSNQGIVCDALANVRDSYGRGVLASASLQEITIDIYNCTTQGETKAYDFAILFTANNNQNDITKSSWFSKQQPTLVVNLGKGDYSSWVSEGGATILCNPLDYDDTQADRIIDAACGRITGEDQCQSATKLTPSSTRGEAIPTVPDDQSSICGCDISKSWNDIMIVADSSSAMGKNHFNELRAFILGAMSDITISKSEPYSTRVGVVSYADSTTLVANLTKYDDTMTFLTDKWSFIDGDGTNILGGIDMAIDQMNSLAHRKNSRKVIILGASTYREGIYPFPNNQTLTFKRNFGVIIVIGYGDIHGIGSALLKNISSEGFYIDATNGAPDFSVLTQLICNGSVYFVRCACKANCFCPSQEQNGYFPVARAGQSWPSLGCYWDSTLTTIRLLASDVCDELTAAPGVLAMPKTLQQQQGLISGIPLNVTDAKPGYYIGLTEKAVGEWKWDDGTDYTGNPIIGDGTCAILRQGSGFSTMINATDCKAGYYYACQTDPCSSTRMCSGNSKS